MSSQPRHPAKSKRRPSTGGDAQLSAHASYVDLVTELAMARSEYRLATSMAWTARKRRDAAMDALEARTKSDKWER
jgi:hypothetical protein